MSKFRFEEIAINSTEKKKPVESDKYTYLGLEHLDPGTLKVSRFGSDVAPIGEKLVMKKGDVLFGKRRAYQKKVAIAPFDGIFSAHGMVLRPKTEVIDSEFFPLFISSDYFLDAAIKISVGSLSPTINWKDLKNLEFELPDLETQRQLAKVLWALIDTIENYKILMTKTDELVKSQFIELAKCQKGSTKLSYYLDLDIKNASKELSKESEIVYIEISSIDNSVNRVVSLSKLKFKDAPDSAKQLLRIGDVLVSLVRPNLRKIAINTIAGDNVVGTSGFCVLRSNEKATKEFLRSVVLSDEFTEKMISLSTGSTYPTIKTDNVLDYPVPLLEMDDIDSFSDLVRQSDKSKFHIRKLIQMKIAIWQKGGKIYANI